MGLQIDNFNSPKLTVGNYEKSKAGAVLNDKTASQVAAQESFLTKPSLEDFRRTRDSLKDPETRENFVLEHQMMRDAIWEDAKISLGEMIADPTVEDTNKQLAVFSAQMSSQDVSNAVTNTLNVLAEEAAVMDSGLDETEASAQSRAILIDSINRVNEHKRETMKAINSLKLNERSLGNKAWDFVEIMAPLAEWNHVDRMVKEATGTHGEGVTNPTSFLLGEQKARLYDQIKKMPIEQRGAFIEEVIRLVQDHEDVILPDGNDILALDTLEKMLVDNDYSNFDRWFDNATSILDMVGVGGLVRGLTRGGRKAVKAPKAEPKPDGLDGEILDPVQPEPRPTSGALESGEIIEGTVEEVQSYARIEATRTDVPPTAPSQIVKDYNPEAARQMHRVADEDASGEAAMALYGTSRDEAMAKDLLPEPEKTKGKMDNKVPMFDEPNDIRNARLANGNTQLSPDEIRGVHERLINSFRDVEGMNLHKESMVIRSYDDGRLSISARYSPQDSGHVSPEKAIEAAEYAFRHYGLTSKDFKLLAQNGDKWVETSAKDIAAKRLLTSKGAKAPELEDAGYAIGFDFDYRFRPEDLESIELLSTGSSFISRGVQFLDRMPSQFSARLGQGSIVQNLLDAASLIHPQIVNAASVAVDRSFGLKKLYVDLFQDFTDTYKGLSKDRRALMTDYIQQANLEGIPFNVADLYSRGFKESEIKALKQWRKANDAMWHASNADMVKTLRLKGYQTLVHKGSDTHLIGKPIKKGDLSNEKVMYDVASQQNMKLDADVANKIYEDGGTLVRMPEPIQIDGQWVDLAISRNSPESGYLRALYDGEVVMNYRDGYYPVMYDANYFITKQITMPDGRKIDKVVASAKTKAEVNRALDQLRTNDPTHVYKHRQDRSNNNLDQQLFDEGSWGLVTNSNLSSQRVRGKRVVDAGVDMHLAGHSNLKDPLEAVATQIESLSKKTAMRTYLESTKRRWMLQYGKHMDLKNPDQFPESIKEVKGKYGIPSKLEQEARTTYNYLYGLENGYINHIDNMYKGVLHAAAEFAGDLGFGAGEKTLFYAGNMIPSHQAKGLAFNVFIASNPARQAVVQRGQILMLGSANAQYAATKLVPDLLNLDAVRMGLSKNPEYVKLFEEVKNSGVIEAVDAHNFIRKDLLKLADISMWDKAKSGLAWPIRQAQKIGFDFAEQDVLMSAWLTFRDKAIRDGKDLSSQRAKDEILGQARAFTLNMNRAGEMPYSQNTVSVMAQFFSFQHKAFLQGLTNSSLTRGQRLKLLAYSTALFGMSATPAVLAVDYVFGKEPSEEKDVFKDGLIHTGLNLGLTLASGKDQNVDWGDLAPAEAYGMGDVFIGMVTMDIAEMVSAAPVSSLLMGANPRLTDAFKTGFRYFVPGADYDDPMLQTKFSDVVVGAANVFSGFSAQFRAQYAMQTRQKMSSSGRISDSDVTGVEAALASLGFQTETETGYRAVKEVLYGDKPFADDDVVSWYREVKRHLARRGVKSTEANMASAIYGEAWRVFGEDRPRAMNTIIKELEKDAADGDFVFIKSILREMGIVSEDDMWKIINKMPSGDMRDRATDLMKFSYEGDDNG